MSKVGFVTMGESAGGEDIPTVGVGMLGYGFMGKAHSNAYKTLAYMTWPPPLMPQLVSIAGRNEEAVAAAAGRYGFADHVTDWKKLVADPRIGVFDNSGPNNFHAEPTIAAAEAGKHVICEKPLGRTADEAYETWQRVAATGVKAMCAFNYRFVPAVRLAREIIASGDLGEIFHFRGRYLQEWIIDADFPMVWRLDKDVAGLGRARRPRRARDRPRPLPGRRDRRGQRPHAHVRQGPRGRRRDRRRRRRVRRGLRRTARSARSRPRASRRGRKNALQFEINGSKGSLSFDIERLNELEVHYRDSSPGKLSQGFRTVLVSEADHPFWEHWWPQGHMIGWEHTFVHEIHHFLSAIRDDTDIAPHGATFEDGYRAAEICDAMLRSDESGSPRDRSPTGPRTNCQWEAGAALAHASRYDCRRDHHRRGHLLGGRDRRRRRARRVRLPARTARARPPARRPRPAHRLPQGRLAGALRRRPDRLPPGLPDQEGLGLAGDPLPRTTCAT